MRQLLTLLTMLLVFPVALAGQMFFLRRFLAPSMVTNMRALKSIAVALCCGITICLASTANAETVTYSWTGTIVSVEVDQGTGTFTGTQVGDTFSGTFTYDPDEANISGLDTSDGDSVIEPGDVWAEYHLGSSSAVLTDGTTELIAPGATVSITTNYPLNDQGVLDWIYALFGIDVALGTLGDSWGLDFGDGIFEFVVAYASFVNMQDDLSFRSTPPWSPPGSPDDPDNQLATFEISEYSDYDQEELIYFAIGVVNGIEVLVDIKPGSDPNSVNPEANGVIPVAILTTNSFDAASVDPLTVEFGPSGAVESHGHGHTEDFDGDGDLDLILHFKVQDSGIRCGDTSAFLIGSTFDGQLIEGFDPIITVGCE